MRNLLLLLIMTISISGCAFDIGVPKENTPNITGTWYYDCGRRIKEDYHRYVAIRFHPDGKVIITPWETYTVDYWKEGEGTYIVDGYTLTLDLIIDVIPHYDFHSHVIRKLLGGKICKIGNYTWLEIDMEVSTDGTVENETLIFRDENPNATSK